MYDDLTASVGADGKKRERVLCSRGRVGVRRGMGIMRFEERTFSPTLSEIGMVLHEEQNGEN